MADLFDSALSLEEQHIEEGMEAGRRDAEAAGLSEGTRIGWQKGFNLAEEVGFIGGCCSAWKRAAQKQPGLFSERVLRAVDTLSSQVSSFPLKDPSDEGIDEALAALRGKFKAIVAMMGKTEAFFPRDTKPGPGNLDF
eukprot:CAMPEP_0117675820 /NCGR_PEP_ID=MMETSP0804-20121206/15821_1 /TAXON_ID=1074897 /ORGANISM="Tetraselmis astigmatica, Strain CCMP880" /LENGTH=137 /DNA_ID=CAMNT_0005484873 /DNA_START=32 /DNA_END=445 /DNA_ORIENTATION=-